MNIPGGFKGFVGKQTWEGKDKVQIQGKNNF